MVGQRNVRKQIHATLGVRIFCGTRTDNVTKNCGTAVGLD
jgi:hypothetical protein